MLQRPWKRISLVEAPVPRGRRYEILRGSSPKFELANLSKHAQWPQEIIQEIIQEDVSFRLCVEVGKFPVKGPIRWQMNHDL